MCISTPLIILQFLWYSELKSSFRSYSEKVSDGMDQQLESPVQGKDRGRQGDQCPEQGQFPHSVLPRLYEVDVTIASVTASHIPWGLENKFHSWPTVELGHRPLSLPLGLLPVHRVRDRCLSSPCVPFGEKVPEQANVQPVRYVFFLFVSFKSWRWTPGSFSWIWAWMKLWERWVWGSNQGTAGFVSTEAWA